MRRLSTFFVSLAAIIGVSLPASAATYSVTSAVSDSLHSGNHNHAVWLPFFESISGSPLFGHSEGSDFDFVPAGSYVVGPTGASTLSGRIVSQVNSAYAFDIVVNFTPLAGPGSGGPKKELRSCAYGGSCGSIDPSTWKYSTLTSGTFTGAGSFSGVNFDISERPLGGKFPMQLGVGANGKNGNLGIASWFFLTVIGDCDHAVCAGLSAKQSLVGDFNLDLQEVPIPAGFLLFMTGVIGLFTARKAEFRKN